MRIFYNLLTTFISVTILLVVTLPLSGYAPCMAANHLILIDTSNSMKCHLDDCLTCHSESSAQTKLYPEHKNLNTFLKDEILGSGEVFKDGDSLIIRSFNDKLVDNTAMTCWSRDSDRIFPGYGEENKINLDQKTRSLIQELIENKLHSTHCYTDLTEGLELGYKDIGHYFNPSKPTIIWMITDNEQDLSDMAGEARWNITPFYEKIYHDSWIEMSYFIPIITNLKNPKYNLICYAFL